jgi:two-component system sensor histidine kinase PilS (NtrC family)
MRSGLAILYLFPLAGLAILAPLMLALFCASLVALFMLGDTTWQIFLTESDRDVMQAGLYGAAFLAAVLVVNRMAAKLIGQEELANQRGVEINVQQAVNRLVMANIGDGILVVDPDGQVVAGNPAAQQMLGLVGPELRSSCRPRWRWRRWRRLIRWREDAARHRVPHHQTVQRRRAGRHDRRLERAPRPGRAPESALRRRRHPRPGAERSVIFCRTSPASKIRRSN